MMNEIQRYEFDRQGFLVIEKMLTEAQVASLARAVDGLEEHAVARLGAPPRKRSPWGRECPYDTNDPDREPGVVGLEVKAGDAIFFTEALRHGGLTNRSTQVRKTLHVGYGPHFMMSQNIATMDEPPYLTDATRARLTAAQLDLFRPYSAP